MNSKKLKLLTTNSAMGAKQVHECCQLHAIQFRSLDGKLFD